MKIPKEVSMALPDKNTETLIFDAAKKVFMRSGLEGARMQEIADTAGINKALLHYYFRSKERLFEAVFNDAFSKYIPALLEMMNSDLDLETKIRNFFDVHISFLQKNPELPMFIMNEIHRNPERIKTVLFENTFSKNAKLYAQITEEMEKGNIPKMHPLQFVVNMLSLSIFPFLAQPLMTLLLDMVKYKGKHTFEDFTNERKKILADYVINACFIKKKRKRGV
jgi:TetR/AcrR family transcriptional regulator